MEGLGRDFLPLGGRSCAEGRKEGDIEGVLSLDVNDVGGFRLSECEDDFCPEGSFMRETDKDLGRNLDWFSKSGTLVVVSLSMSLTTSSSLVSSSWDLEVTGSAELAGAGVTGSAVLAGTGVSLVTALLVRSGDKGSVDDGGFELAG